MKTKEKHLLLFLFLFLTACSGSEVIGKFPPVENKYDSSKPKEITSMKPLTGRIDDNFVIEGNLGDNIEDMRVYFDERKAVLLRTDGHTLHGIVPKQPDGYNKITVVLGKDSIITDIEFRYRQNQIITTIAGNYTKKLDWSGNKLDGSLTEATFTMTEGITVVAGNNILVSDEWACLRLVSQEDEKVVSITGNWTHKFGDGAVNKARDVAYFFHFDKPSLWRCKRTDGWVPTLIRPESQMVEFKGIARGVTFGADERYIYIREHNGKFGRFDLESEGIPFKVLLETTPETDARSQICYCPVSDCFYYSSYTHHGIGKVWQDKTTGVWKEERYAGYNGAGRIEGNRLTEAKFSQPTGLCADADGNLYVCCMGSQSIMKVWLKSGYVEHVAGKGDDRNLPLLNGKPLESRFREPHSIAIDDEGNFILGCVNDGEIRKYAIE